MEQIKISSVLTGMARDVVKSDCSRKWVTASLKQEWFILKMQLEWNLLFDWSLAFFDNTLCFNSVHYKQENFFVSQKLLSIRSFFSCFWIKFNQSLIESSWQSHLNHNKLKTRHKKIVDSFDWQNRSEVISHLSFL